jgi:hypothetical protein
MERVLGAQCKESGEVRDSVEGMGCKFTLAPVRDHQIQMARARRTAGRRKRKRSPFIYSISD